MGGAGQCVKWRGNGALIDVINLKAFLKCHVAMVTSWEMRFEAFFC